MQVSNPYAFIVGCPRSGTTLLQRMMDAHPNIAVVPEAPWIYQLPRHSSGMTSEGRVTADLLPALLQHPKFAPLGITRDQLLPLTQGDYPIPYSTFVQRVFDLYGTMQGKD